MIVDLSDSYIIPKKSVPRIGARGPLERFGAKGAGRSVYFRDPDGSLLEFISYANPGA